MSLDSHWILESVAPTHRMQDNRDLALYSGNGTLLWETHTTLTLTESSNPQPTESSIQTEWSQSESSQTESGLTESS